ncbi:hypothetical protein BBI01_17860 [Chryseobacterium artocarpi]|uniref:Metallo-beta-lactamase domain-containing protein n=1 Tax=Chryseobacterium artocarpi TaxID=1414727 RepID=A0A1B8ZBS9_9FLAO|nr:MBL fold metallo-hydrolase [Chryseobacterium artocarpi]OCA69078.1 hypothetical protein BBI01_17860 [Chryseobacterium artocarpi]
MEIEINMINVEDGDAIILMLKNSEKKSLIVIDGGYKAHYPKIKKRLEEVLPLYDNKIDLLICTHYDNDHIGGVEKILDDYHQIVQEIWIHTIKETVDEEIHFLGKQLTELKQNLLLEDIDIDSSSKYIIEGYEDLLRVVRKIRDYGLEDKMSQVFKGKEFGKFPIFSVIGPTYDFYRQNLPALKSEAIEEDLKANFDHRFSSGIPKLSEYLKNSLNTSGNEADCKNLEVSSLRNGVTATNMVSIVTLLQFDNKKFLFTGDAGIESFEKHIPNWDTDLKDLYFLDLPHHGSKNNTSKKMIDVFNPNYVFVSARSRNNRPSSHIESCIKSRKNLVRFEITNRDSKTWYIKIDQDGNFSRIFRI